jgi:hypothetical protein
MTLNELMRAVDTLSDAELLRLFAHLEEQRVRRFAAREIETPTEDRTNAPLDMRDLEEIFAEIRTGFTEHDLQELEWAMNNEFVEALPDDLA